jgi:hypothetical protein
MVNNNNNNNKTHKSNEREPKEKARVLHTRATLMPSTSWAGVLVLLPCPGRLLSRRIPFML